MIDINLLRKSPKDVKIALKTRQIDESVLDKIINLDENFRQLLSETETLRASQNSLSKEFKGKPTPTLHA